MTTQPHDAFSEWRAIELSDDERQKLIAGETVEVAPGRPDYRIEVDRTQWRYRYVPA